MKSKIKEAHLIDDLKSYYGHPSPEPHKDFYAIRDDIAICEIKDILLKGIDVRVLDCCAGEGSVAKHISDTIASDELKRIDYFAIDNDRECYSKLSNSSYLLERFKDFHPMLRMAHDLGDLKYGSFHLIFLLNAIHEISPVHLPKVLYCFNNLLSQDQGRFLLVDMEELPQNQPEASAITWTSSEIGEILESGGFPPSAVSHNKSSKVFVAKVFRQNDKPNIKSMLNTIILLLENKLHLARVMWKTIQCQKITKEEMIISRVVFDGSVSKMYFELKNCQDALCSMNYKHSNLNVSNRKASLLNHEVMSNQFLPRRNRKKSEFINTKDNYQLDRIAR
ncbi:MAG TPA: hypothetical protein PLI09_12880 [Candidatus Hydrogenedentes bacterium]|nr:hypothetical protein [Candidatus Hydrogenedentota bacterium]